IALKFEDLGAQLLRILLDPRLGNHRVQLGVARLIVAAVETKTLISGAALRPVLDRQRPDGAASGYPAGGRDVGPTLPLAMAVAEVRPVLLCVVERPHL